MPSRPLPRKPIDDADGLVVVTCSALKRTYRDRLRSGMEVRPRFVLLHGRTDLLGERIKHRKGHFMPPSMPREPACDA